MVGQKSRRNSGFLPPLAADGVYDHNCVQFPAPSDMLGGRRKGLPPKALFFSKATPRTLPFGAENRGPT